MDYTTVTRGHSIIVKSEPSITVTRGRSTTVTRGHSITVKSEHSTTVTRGHSLNVTREHSLTLVLWCLDSKRFVFLD
jgi:hypothetical protein